MSNHTKFNDIFIDFLKVNNKKIYYIESSKSVSHKDIVNSDIVFCNQPGMNLYYYDILKNGIRNTSKLCKDIYIKIPTSHNGNEYSINDIIWLLYNEIQNKNLVIYDILLRDEKLPEPNIQYEKIEYFGFIIRGFSRNLHSNEEIWVNYVKWKMK